MSLLSPCCGVDTEVIDSRPNRYGTSIRRRRVCSGCRCRFSTVEIPAVPKLRTVDQDMVARRLRMMAEALVLGAGLIEGQDAPHPSARATSDARKP